MVQNISTQPSNNLGTINKIGITDNGRAIYQVTDNTGKVAGKMSIAQKDCDKFEKSYNQLMTTAPKLQAYMQNTPPEKIAQKQKLSKWVVGGCALLGGLWPALKAKGTFKQISLTLLGTGVGLIGGLFIANKVTTPPGAKEFAEATQTIAKLDIQPLK